MNSWMGFGEPEPRTRLPWSHPGARTRRAPRTGASLPALTAHTRAGVLTLSPARADRQFPLPVFDPVFLITSSATPRGENRSPFLPSLFHLPNIGASCEERLASLPCSAASVLSDGAKDARPRAEHAGHPGCVLSREDLAARVGASPAGPSAHAASQRAAIAALGTAVAAKGARQPHGPEREASYPPLPASC